jgi:hypothetical protein
VSQNRPFFRTSSDAAQRLFARTALAPLPPN